MINADKKKEMKNLSEMLLETRNLTKQYGHHKAVDSVNMHIKKGSITKLMGFRIPHIINSAHINEF